MRGTVNTILMKRIRRRAARAIFSRLFMDRGGSLRNTVFLAGSGRSGTTWVSHLINYRNEYRYIFEPFYPDAIRNGAALGYGRHLRSENSAYGQYLRTDNNDLDLLASAEVILSGRVRNVWIDRYNRCFISHKRLIKDIRANLLLKWLCTHFPETRIILLLRHPCAVASSRTKLGWVTYSDELLSQSELLADFLHPFRDAIVDARTDFEKHIMAWCIENYVPLKQFQNGEIHVAFYENFCRQPSREIGRMFSFLGESFSDRALQHVAIPVEGREGSAIFSGADLVDSWRAHISASQLSRACEIVKLFSLDRVYSQESMPDVSRACELMDPAGRRAEQSSESSPLALRSGVAG